MSVVAMFAQRHPLLGGAGGGGTSGVVLHPGGGRGGPASRARPTLELPPPHRGPPLHTPTRAPLPPTRATSPREAAGGASTTTGPGGSAGGVTVRAADDTPANVTVGPYLFDLALGLHMADTRAPADVIQAHYRSGSLTVDGEPTPRWLAYVQAARDRHEQTVEAFRDQRGYIFYRTMRALRAGQELLVWYGDELARECGIPVLTPSNIRGDQQYVCTTCNKSYKHPNCLKAHIRFRCAPTTRLDFLSSRSTDPWLHLAPSPPRRSSETPRSPPEVRSLSPSTSGPAGPMNLKIGEGSAFRPPRRESGSGSEVSRQSPDSTRDLRESPREQRREKHSPTVFPPRSPPTASASTTPTTTTPASEKRYDLPSPAKAVSLKDAVGTKFPLRSDVPACVPQPVQIFNHIHPPAFPVPMDSATLKYYYAPLYNKLSAASAAAAAAAGQMCYNRMMTKPPCLPSNYLDTLYYQHHHAAHSQHPFGHHKLPAGSPGGEHENHKLEDALKSSPHHHTMDAAPEGACLPFAFPLPSEKAGEPLDLLPRSLYMHKSRKGHLCIYCGKLYSRKYGLKIHLRTHTGYKPLKCKVCLRPFGDPSNLNKHIRLHAEGDTPYRCDYCGKVLVRRRDLERHIKSRHPNQAPTKDADLHPEVSSSNPRGDLLTGEDELLLHRADGSPGVCADSSIDSADSVGSLEGEEGKDYIDVEDEDDDDEVVRLGEGQEEDMEEDMDDTEIEVVS